MPRPSSLRMTKQQEDDLLAFLEVKKAQLLQDNSDRINKDRASWKAYENDALARAQMPKSIFGLNNIHLPITSMIVEHFVSKTEDETTGEAPFFHFDPVGNPVSPIAMDQRSQMNAYHNWKLTEEGNAHENLQDAQLSIFIQRATILKAVFDTDEQVWVDYDAKILHEKATGKPVEILNHGPIIEGESEFVPVVDHAGTPDEAGQLPIRQHLQADPSFVLDPEQHEFRQPPEGLRRREVVRRGPKSILVDYDAFLCPSDARTIDEADCVCELQDRDAVWFNSMWLERPWAQWSDVTSMFTKTGTAKPKQQTERNTEDNKQAADFDIKNPVRKVDEWWIRRDVLEWGEPQTFVCYVDTESRKLVWYEFQPLVTPDGLRPYTAIAIGKGKQRWWGHSIPEKLDQFQDAIDKMFNGEFYRQMQRSNPPKGGDPGSCEEEPEVIEYDPTGYYRLKAGKKIQDLLSYAEVPDSDQRTQMMIEYLLFIIQLWLGVSNIGQGDISKIPDDPTAAGIERTMEESSKLARRWIRRVIKGIEEHVSKLVQITMTTVPENSQEVFEFTQGQDLMQGLIDTNTIRRLKIKVAVVVSQRYGQQEFKANEQAMEIQARYLQTPPQLMPIVRPLMVEALQVLGFKDTDRLLPLPEVMAAALPPVVPGAPADPGQPPPAGTEAPPPEIPPPLPPEPGGAP